MQHFKQNILLEDMAYKSNRYKDLYIEVDWLNVRKSCQVHRSFTILDKWQDKIP